MASRLLKTSGVIAAALVVLAAGAPAAAAELPDHQRLSTIDYISGIFYDIDPASGAATEVWDTGLEGAIGLTLDATGRGFATTSTGPDWRSSLWTVDVAAQTVVEVAPITLAGDPTRSGVCHSLQLSAGTLYAYCGFYEFPGGTNTFSVIDQATGVFTPIFVFSTGGSEDISPAIDPADGTTFFTANDSVYEFDLDTFDPTAPGSIEEFKVGEFPAYVVSGSFSEGSVLWAPLPDFTTQTTRLATWDRATGLTEVVGEIASADSVYTFVVAVWGAPAPAPQLAATGAMVVPGVILGAGVLLLGGFVLVAVRRRAAQ